jgi:hypothetical protein
VRKLIYDQKVLIPFEYTKTRAFLLVDRSDPESGLGAEFRVGVSGAHPGFAEIYVGVIGRQWQH